LKNDADMSKITALKTISLYTFLADNIYMMLTVHFRFRILSQPIQVSFNWKEEGTGVYEDRVGWGLQRISSWSVSKL
jgi:hypothetical protein